MNGALQLFEYLADLVRLSCEKGGRSGQYRKQKLIERYGADARLPDLREEIAQCGRHGQTHDACMVRYIDLLGVKPPGVVANPSQPDSHADGWNFFLSSLDSLAAAPVLRTP